MIGVSSDSYQSYTNFSKGYWFDNKVVDCSSIECNKKYDFSIKEMEEINKDYLSYNISSISNISNESKEDNYKKIPIRDNRDKVYKPNRLNRPNRPNKHSIKKLKYPCTIGTID